MIIASSSLQTGILLRLTLASQVEEHAERQSQWNLTAFCRMRLLQGPCGS